MSQLPTEQEIEQLLKELLIAEAPRRQVLIDMLKESGIHDESDERVVQALNRIATQDSDQVVRQAASDALGAIGRTLPLAAEQAPPSKPASTTSSTPGKLPKFMKNYNSWMERGIDFVIGFVGWYVIYGSLWIQEVEPYADRTPAYLRGLGVLMYTAACFVCNIWTLAVPALFRRWIAMGVLVALAVNFILALIRGMFQNGLCAVPFFTLDVSRP